MYQGNYKVMYEVLGGSRARGLQLESSDFDWRRVVRHTNESYWSLTPPPEHFKGYGDDEEYESLLRFMRLLLNPNKPDVERLEWLFAPNSWSRYAVPFSFKHLRAVAPRFVSKQHVRRLVAAAGGWTYKSDVDSYVWGDQDLKKLSGMLYQGVKALNNGDEGSGWKLLSDSLRRLVVAREMLQSDEDPDESLLEEWQLWAKENDHLLPRYNERGWHNFPVDFATFDSGVQGELMSVRKGEMHLGKALRLYSSLMTEVCGESDDGSSGLLGSSNMREKPERQWGEVFLKSMM